ncbi:MAG: T9SS type A sorting domain-containing protein, partial [Saprospiraceae bacterium]|nr:T9SS type A sorting domain-containing protein [Saprospiraceae bacterium]
WGEGTGGIIAMNALFLDDYQKIPGASNGKLLWDHDQNPATPPAPMVLDSVRGNLYGTTTGIDPATGDTLCLVNHPGYTSGFQLAVNLSGFCLDTAWVDPGQAPLISFHVPFEPYYPYAEGVYKVVSHLPVELVQGSYVVQHLLEAYGNNQVYTAPVIPGLQPEQVAAFARTPVLNNNNWKDFTPGLYPFVVPVSPPSAGSYATKPYPWEWSAPVFDNPTCNTDKTPALLYWDTIMKFYAPRACFALGLQTCIDQVLSGKEAPASDIDVLAAPNPAVDQVRFTAEEEILAIQVFDHTGRLVRAASKVESDNYTLQRDGLNAGSYVVKLRFKTGFVTKLVHFE